MGRHKFLEKLEKIFIKDDKILYLVNDRKIYYSLVIEVSYFTKENVKTKLEVSIKEFKNLDNNKIDGRRYKLVSDNNSFYIDDIVELHDNWVGVSSGYLSSKPTLEWMMLVEKKETRGFDKVIKTLETMSYNLGVNENVFEIRYKDYIMELSDYEYPLVFKIECNLVDKNIRLHFSKEHFVELEEVWFIKDLVADMKVTFENETHILKFTDISRKESVFR